MQSSAQAPFVWPNVDDKTQRVRLDDYDQAGDHFYGLDYMLAAPNAIAGFEIDFDGPVPFNDYAFLKVRPDWEEREYRLKQEHSRRAS